MTTRIDFHSNVNNRLDYACRLVRKALAAHCRLIVQHNDLDQLAQFDQLLWQFSATEFLPHVDVSSGEHPLAKYTPVLLCLNAEANTLDVGTGIDILINLSNNVPANFTQFKRLLEIIPQPTQSDQSSVIQAGRERYRFYQQQGFQLNHITAK